VNDFTHAGMGNQVIEYANIESILRTEINIQKNSSINLIIRMSML
jgi:hypothetical protein